MEKRELLIARFDALMEIVARKPAMKKRRGPLSPKKRAWKKFKTKWFKTKKVRNPFMKTKVSLTSFSIVRDPNTLTEKNKIKAIRDRVSKAKQRKADTPAEQKAKQLAVKKANSALTQYKKTLLWHNKMVPQFQEEKNAARRAFNAEWLKKAGKKKAASADVDDWAESVLTDLLEE